MKLTLGREANFEQNMPYFSTKMSAISSEVVRFPFCKKVWAPLGLLYLLLTSILGCQHSYLIDLKFYQRSPSLSAKAGYGLKSFKLPTDYFTVSHSLSHTAGYIYLGTIIFGGLIIGVFFTCQAVVIVQP